MRGLRGNGERQEDLIARLCRESGRWMLVEREADSYRVRPINDPRSPRYVDIRYAEQWLCLVFQSWFPVRFSLENPPSGLFGRLLMRSAVLKSAAWAVHLAGNCEAVPSVIARLPRQGIDAALFDAVCREVVNEIDDFHQELRDKFRYGVSGVVAPGRVTGTVNRPIQPAVPEVQFIEPVQHHLGQNGRYRMLPGQGG